MWNIRLMLRFHFLLTTIVAAFFVFLSSQIAFATSDEQAAELCKDKMLNQEGALDVRDVHVRRRVDPRNEKVPYAFGTADFSDAKGVHFRCRVFQEKAYEVKYLVKDPELEGARGWSTDRSHQDEHHGINLDEAAKSLPPTEISSPHFERVPGQ